MVIALSTWCQCGCSLTVAPQRGWYDCSRVCEGDAVGRMARDRQTGRDQVTGVLYIELRNLDLTLLAMNSKN